MYKLVVLAALLAVAVAKPTTLITSPALAPAYGPAPLAYASYPSYAAAAPYAYTSGLAYSAGYVAPSYYKTGPIAYDYAPLAYY